VRAYHGALQRLGIKPARAVEDDARITEEVLKPVGKLRAV
jgi:hypothetical protein